MYRVWGGTSREIGPWMSPIDYGASASMMLALPPGNMVSNTSTFMLSACSRVLTGTVAPLFNQPGGGIQLWYPLWTL